jgi:protein-tyrosine phosphatase
LEIAVGFAVNEVIKPATCASRPGGSKYCGRAVNKMKTVLFLCTGNYYRSRFAQEFFNHLAANSTMNWQARSRGLALERGINNIGPLSPLVFEALKKRGIVAQGADRPPQQCAPTDFENATHVVALDEAEHRPLVRERFADWERQIEYWSIADVGFVRPDVALAEIAAQVEALLARFGSSSAS